jgi:hypothetical protein
VSSEIKPTTSSLEVPYDKPDATGRTQTGRFHGDAVS